MIHLACTLGVVLLACARRPSEAELARWRREAQRQNAASLARHARAETLADWALVVSGETRSRAPWRSTLAELARGPTTVLRTRTPFQNTAPVPEFNFRGISVATLLDRVGVADGVTEVTFLAYDGYFVTVPLDDLRHFPIMLAFERNGSPLARADGGPILLVFPHTSHPETLPRFAENFWCFYVTDVILGSSEPEVTVAGRTFRAADLAALPQTSIDVRVGYRLRWPAGRVRLGGVRVRDLLAAANVAVTPTSIVRVRDRSVVDRDLSHANRLDGDDVLRHDALVVLRYGDPPRPIPTSLGGPVTLGIPEDIPDPGQRIRWTVMVRGIEVQTP